MVHGSILWTIIEGFIVDKKLTEPQHSQSLKWLAQLAASLISLCKALLLLPERIISVATYGGYCFKAATTMVIVIKRQR